MQPTIQPNLYNINHTKSNPYSHITNQSQLTQNVNHHLQESQGSINLSQLQTMMQPPVCVNVS